MRFQRRNYLIAMAKRSEWFRCSHFFEGHATFLIITNIYIYDSKIFIFCFWFFFYSLFVYYFIWTGIGLVSKCLKCSAIHPHISPIQIWFIELAQMYSVFHLLEVVLASLVGTSFCHPSTKLEGNNLPLLRRNTNTCPKSRIWADLAYQREPHHDNQCQRVPKMIF